MPWNGKPRSKPLVVDHCCCSECGGACPDPPAQALARCEPCHYGERHGTGGMDYLHWYCAGAGHRDDKCSTYAEHRLKVAAQWQGINEMLRCLDFAMDVATDAKWCQMTFESLEG